MEAGNSDLPEGTDQAGTSEEGVPATRVTEPPEIEYETHLEGNINVIENQNNENLERDHERMEAEHNSGSLEAKDSEKDTDRLNSELIPPEDVDDIPLPPLDDAPSAHISESVDDSIENRLSPEPECIAPVNKNTEEKQDSPEELPQSISTEIDKETETEGDIPPEKEADQENETQDRPPSICDELDTSKEDLDDNIADDSEQIHDDVEKDNSPEPVVDKSTEKIDDLENIAQTDVESSSNVIDQSRLEFVRTEVDSVDVDGSPKEAEIDTSKSISEQIDESEVSASKNDDNALSISENLDNSEIETNTTTESLSDTTTKHSEIAAVEESTDILPETAEKSTEESEKPTEETDKCSEEAEKRSESEKAPSEIGSAISDTTDHNENGDSIQFAQVNFDHNNQKEGEDKDTEDPDKDDCLEKTVEMDPIAASTSIIDELEAPEDSRQGADEELCIIPDDTEREIPKAPQVASSSATEEPGLRVKNFADNADAPAKETPLAFVRKCASCKKVAEDVETNLTWEIMDFCNEFCLSKYQREVGAKCSSCKGDVKASSLGKYCVRFGNDIRQFCTSTCLEQYKKGLKVCSYCQQDMSNGPEGFLAPVGDKGQFKDFCSKVCMDKYDIMTNDRPPKVAAGTLCSVCKTEKPITIDFEFDGAMNYFCGEPCFVAFSFVNNISPGKCAMCRRHFNKSTLEKHTMCYDNVQYSFCSNSCENIYIIAHRKIVPCSWCKVKKYNFDMIKKYSKSGGVINMCSINCLSLFQVSLNAVNSKRITCNYCQKNAHPMYHLTMSDATIRNFCTYNCVMSFQNQFPKQPITLNSMGESGFPVPTGGPKKNKKCPSGANENCTSPVPTETPPTPSPALPVISSVQSLASTNGAIASALLPTLTPINTSRLTRSKAHNTGPTTNASNVVQAPPIQAITELPVQIQLKQHYIVKPLPCPEQRNVATMCSVRKAVKIKNSGNFIFTSIHQFEIAKLDEHVHNDYHLAHKI